MIKLQTRMTDRLGIDVPILNAPMGAHAGGQMAAAISAAGGLGLVAGFGALNVDQAAWLDTQMTAAGGARVGAGYITWRLAEQPHLLAHALSHAPAAIMLSFADPAPFAPAIRAAGVPLICQVQNLQHARMALAAGADILAAQGGEAGGHGSNNRGTFTLVPEIADLLARESPDTLLLAAGGVADGRGLAAALMLGADGVLVGTRFWTSVESLALDSHKNAAVAAQGDGTLRNRILDIVNNLPWPREFTARVLRNTLTARWHDDEVGLRAAIDQVRAGVREARAAGDVDQALINAGECVGLIAGQVPAGVIVATMAADAARRLGRA